MNEPREPRPRREAAELIRACHEAVLAEVVEVGIGRLTMEGVARRAAAAKTSLYRRWSSPEALLLEALGTAHPELQSTPATDDLRADLIHSLHQLSSWLGGPTALAVAEIFAERHRHPELVEALYAQVYDKNGGRFTDLVLHQHAEQGRIDPSRVTPVVTDIGEALVIKHNIDNGRLPDDAEIAAIVDQAILPAVGVFPT